MIFSPHLSLALLTTLATPAFCRIRHDHDPRHLDTRNSSSGDSGDDNEHPPHQGCLLLLEANHTHTPLFVGESYEGITASDYTVANEIGPTAATCVNGMAGGYPCSNVDLLSTLTINELNLGDTANDIWGWTHDESGREFALVGMKMGTAFVEVTDPANPVHLGGLPTQWGLGSPWRDIKTIGHFALIVSEAAGHGMQIFDLEELLTAKEGSVFSETKHYAGFGNAHNIFVNEDTNIAYAVGTNTCDQGLHMVDVSDVMNPVSAGCFSKDGYTHGTCIQSCIQHALCLSPPSVGWPASGGWMGVSC